MSAFGWLKKTLGQHQQSGCEPTPEAANFVSNYKKQVESAKQALRERQAKERKDRSS